MHSLRLSAANARMSLIGYGEKNTGEWILTDSRYRGWRNEPSPTRFWLHGTSGAGKSTLAKQVIANMLRMAGADPNPHNGLFRNIWDFGELNNLVKHSEMCIDLEGRLPSLLTEAAVQFINMVQTSNTEEMYRRALEGRERVLGVEHPNTLTSVGNLALVLRELGKYAAAEEMYRRALEGRERMLGPEHPNTSSSAYNLAALLHIQKRYGDASPLYLRASEGFSKTLGPNHPTTQECFQHCSSIMHEIES